MKALWLISVTSILIMGVNCCTRIVTTEWKCETQLRLAMFREYARTHDDRSQPKVEIPKLEEEKL